MNFFRLIFSEEFIFTAIQLTIPILFAAMAALISNKAGISNINIEGSMSVSALIGALVSFYSQSFMLGMLAGIATGVLMGMILAFCAHILKTDSVLSGVTLNIFATGFVVFLMYAVLGTKGDTTSAPSVQIPYLYIPWLSDIPYLGLLFSQNILFYIAVAVVVLVSIMLKKTKMGLRLKSVGFNPVASDSVGISVARTQLVALILAGVCAGLGGVFLSMAYLDTFNSGMVAGRGFIGLAAEAMGAGQPLMTVLFAFIFGIVTAFSTFAPIEFGIPYELVNALPYLITIIALIIIGVKNKVKDPTKAPKLKAEGRKNEKSMGK